MSVPVSCRRALGLRYTYLCSKNWPRCRGWPLAGSGGAGHGSPSLPGLLVTTEFIWIKLLNPLFETMFRSYIHMQCSIQLELVYSYFTFSMHYNVFFSKYVTYAQINLSTYKIFKKSVINYPATYVVHQLEIVIILASFTLPTSNYWVCATLFVQLCSFT